MLRMVVLVGLVFSSFSGINAQNLNLTGTVKDQQNKAPLSGATVQLKSFSDSAFSKELLTDSAGAFNFTNLKRDSFMLTLSFVGYNTITRGIAIDSSDVSINVFVVPNSSQELATVIITSTPAPVIQKGDTLQISASQFKVNPDASGEDLIKKVPGVTIENGQVKAQGENVQKVTIDGRELFGDDATAALRNLPAEIIDKIQIFDRLSDQAQFTGFDDGNTSKSINIITKANMRNGQFGRVFAGYGTGRRYQAGGNTTILKENKRISVVGNLNNINQQNFSQQDLLGVTSAAQGGGRRQRRGNNGGRTGNPGNTGGGGNNGGFNNSSNFLVGRQNGINKTNAFGINYSDTWSKKVTATGSYLFNNTNNTTSEIANTQYFASSFSSIVDTTLSGSRNNNHRFNLRLEYKIDSFNQLIITPSLNFQENKADRQVGTETFFKAGNPTRQTFNQNATNSTRSAAILNNNILFRHSFAKRGRTFSINVNTAYNKREGASYVNTFNRSFYSSGSYKDTASHRFTNQTSNGLQVSTNFVYTEPLGVNSQLQFNYNPVFSKSKSDQETYAKDLANNKYSIYLNNLSNVFESRIQAHNAGIAYRYGNRDKQISFGANYQQTQLESGALVHKTYRNILPNAMIRYKLSTQSNLRLFYRAAVNQPSVLQLQGVLDPTNAPQYTVGNTALNQQYTHTLSSRYTFTNTAKGFLLVGNVFYQAAANYIASATFTPARDTLVGGETLVPGSRLTKPVNLNGYNSLRSFLTFAVPLKFIKSNFNLNGGVSFSKIPGLSNYIQNLTKNTIYTAGVVIASNVSQYVDFTVSYSANFNKVKNEVQPLLNNNYFQHVASLQLNLLSKEGWFFQNDLNNQYYSGLTAGFNQSYFLWNMSAGKKIFKNQKGEVKLSVFDLLKQNKSISRNVTADYIEDVQNQVLQQYFMLTFTYNLRNFGTAAERAANKRNMDRTK